ncbi:hypothetical protein AKO1_009393 [Acrasis kona]|uniref:Uncharacterized protein n=1 Tax=Acrasis kona TaxID=1008807 RepID=A0AAW2ZM78_9EUKA
MSQRRHTAPELQEQYSDLPISDKKPTQKGVSLRSYYPVLTGLLFVLVLTFCMWGLPLFIMSDWKEICGRSGSCFPDKATCDCKCFDGINKKGYGRGGYKYIYYNSESTTFIIFVIVSTYIVMGERAIGHLTKLLLNRNLSLYAFIGFAATVFPNFYSASAHFNYFNDNIHHLHMHQTYFTLTELLITFCILRTAHADFSDQNSIYSWIGLSISLTHLVQSTKDQTIQNLFVKSNERNRYIPYRDIAFFTSDFIIICYFIFRLNLVQRIKMLLSGKASEANKTLKRDIVVVGFFVFVNVMILSNVTFGG